MARLHSTLFCGVRGGYGNYVNGKILQCPNQDVNRSKIVDAAVPEADEYCSSFSGMATPLKSRSGVWKRENTFQ
jgi:hypothetical protein